MPYEVMIVVRFPTVLNAVHCSHIPPSRILMHAVYSTSIILHGASLMRDRHLRPHALGEAGLTAAAVAEEHGA